MKKKDNNIWQKKQKNRLAREDNFQEEEHLLKIKMLIILMKEIENSMKNQKEIIVNLLLRLNKIQREEVLYD